MVLSVALAARLNYPASIILGGALGSSTSSGAFGDHFGVRSAFKLLGAIPLPVILT